MSNYQFETVAVQVSADGVAHVQLNRPKKLNAFSDQLIIDVRHVFRAIDIDHDIRSVVISGSGRMFTAGLDLSDTPIQHLKEVKDPARDIYKMRNIIKDFQDTFTAIEECSKPVIAAVHNGCFGAGVDLITACDIRYCSKDSFFCVKEVDIGMAADVGSLQRLPKVIGNNSLVRELCLTGRNMYAKEALDCGLVNRVEDNQEAVIAEAFKTARLIATKSPVAVLGTKHMLNHSRDHSVAEGLSYAITWNSAMLKTEDIPLSIKAILAKKPATYSKL